MHANLRLLLRRCQNGQRLAVGDADDARGVIPGESVERKEQDKDGEEAVHAMSIDPSVDH